MARQVTVTITDDIDDSPGAEEVSFAYEGKAYTIDLAKKNRAALEKALKPFIEAGKRAGRATGARRSSGSSGGDLGAIRAWANSNGFEVSTRGRIPADVRAAYDAAH